MYVSKVKFENYGPLEEVNLEIKNVSEGNPKPTVLIGQNGTGKTLFLSNILHAIIEMKRKKYSTLLEVSENNYYRVGSLNYIRAGTLTAYNRIEFTDQASFTEVMTKNYKNLKDSYSAKDYPGVNIEDNKLKETGFFGSAIAPQDNLFDKEVFLFFPVERYYTPTWINKSNENLSYASDEHGFVGKSSSNMVKYNVLSNIEEWLLDVIIDKVLYDEKLFIPDGKGGTQLAYSGPNNSIQATINLFLTILYKHKGYDSARIAVTKRLGLCRQIAIIGKRGEEEHEIMPTMANMSSGEAMLLGMMASILREADRVGVGNFAINGINGIKGIVLIDEIDAHMHSDFIQEALPELIHFFSGIQFIVSSHSPFFLLGMKDKFEDNCNFIEMPFGKNIHNLINFNEIRNCFDVVNKTYTGFIKEYENITDEMRKIKQPLIITEGKTDWKHLKHALNVFHSKGLFKTVNVKFFEGEEAMGADKLDALLSKLAMIDQTAPIIGVFDNDCKVGKKYIKPTPLGNNVYACSITDTQGYGEEISIELLYSREDLTKEWPDKRRLYLTDEFSEKSHQLKTDTSVVSQNKTIDDAIKRKIIKVVDSNVYNDKEKELAVSKEEFARQIYEGKPPYENINVDGFKKIFKTIEGILDKQNNN
ncbi:MAG: AAA family ATPase [Ruminobacter sp.]|uniref:AAA family ATPase n=1 Tax=Ruminobacter sp. TaxID=2774296 RepID=UPI00257E59C0|nr:AAA family ATPase [Ruminobacter sp.]MBQ3775599.1 AAA family ATPase [Ruminobacter sp.]